MNITYIYSNSCLLVLFDLSTVFKQKATLRIHTFFSSTVASLSLHQWSWPLFIPFHKRLQLFISYINIMKSLFQLTNFYYSNLYSIDHYLVLSSVQIAHILSYIVLNPEIYLTSFWFNTISTSKSSYIQIIYLRIRL